MLIYRNDCTQQHSIWLHAHWTYVAFNFNCLQSASNAVLDVNVQEVLPAVQTSCYVRMTSREWWGMVTCPVMFRFLWHIWFQISG